jgi:CheY-like chemotaxis protein
MDTTALNILLVEESRMDADLVGGALRSVPRLAFTLQCVPDLAGAGELLAGGRFDVLILGLFDGEEAGLAAVEAACRLAEHLPVVVMGTHHDDVLAAAAVRLGAQDYLVKGDFDGWMLARAIRQAIERKEVARFQDLTAHVLRELDLPGNWSQVMRGVTKLIRRFTGADAVGIRLADGEDFPCFVAAGFPERFLLQEGALCAHTADGEPLRDKEALIGPQEPEAEVIRPGPRSSDGAYTQIGLTWQAIDMLVESPTDGDDLILLVTPQESSQPAPPGSLAGAVRPQAGPR